MNDRQCCCVPHCRRTRKLTYDRLTVDMGGYASGDTITTDIGEEWICADHWKQVPRNLRTLHFAAKRKVRRTRTLSAMLVFIRVWNRCKRKAIEGAAGI